jgi:predicted DNA-binding ribbon-helix-helix protein
MVESSPDQTAAPTASEAAKAPPEPGPHEIEFRVVSSQGTRHALKLERIFWMLLEAAASASRDRLGPYIGKVLTTASGEQSKSSFLRAHAADWMRRRLVEISATSLARKSLGSIVLAAPMPCFVVTPQNTVEVQNQAFMDLLKARSESTGSALPAIRITFRTDIRTLYAALRDRPSGHHSDYVTIHVGQHASEHQARIAMLASVSGQPAGIVVFLMT